MLCAMNKGHENNSSGYSAYAAWTGIGAVDVAIMGMILFNESRDILKIICLLLIVAGIVGLKLVASS